MTRNQHQQQQLEQLVQLDWVALKARNALTAAASTPQCGMPCLRCQRRAMLSAYPNALAALYNVHSLAAKVEQASWAVSLSWLTTLRLLQPAGMRCRAAHCVSVVPAV